MGFSATGTTEFQPSRAERIKRLVGPRWQRRVRRLNRLRWAKKLRMVATMKGNPGLVQQAAFVLWSPEMESFSYELADERGMLEGIAAALGADPAALAAYAEESRVDPEFGDRLARHLRGRFDVRHRPPLGHRLGWYVLARALKPAAIVETGIYDGLGSLALLRALERNSEEGHPGELLSFDIDPDAGSIVREELNGRWRRFTGSTRELLAPAIADREIGLMIQDTGHDDENQRFEFGLVLAQATPRVVLLDGSGGWAQTLPALCAERGGAYHVISARSRDHVARGVDVAIGVFGADAGRL